MVREQTGRSPGKIQSHDATSPPATAAPHRDSGSAFEFSGHGLHRKNCHCDPVAARSPRRSTAPCRHQAHSLGWSAEVVGPQPPARCPRHLSRQRAGDSAYREQVSRTILMQRACRCPKAPRCNSHDQSDRGGHGHSAPESPHLPFPHPQETG